MDINKNIFNIDFLSLKLPYSKELFDFFKDFPLDYIDYREGYEIQVIDKEMDIKKEEPQKIWLLVSCQEDNIGMFVLDKKDETVSFFVDNEIFYKQLTGLQINGEFLKINMLGCLESMFFDLNFDITAIRIDRIIIVRDCFNDSTLKVIDKYHKKEEYDTIIYGKVEPKSSVLLDNYHFHNSINDNIPLITKTTQMKCVSIENYNHSLSLLSYDKQKEIQDVSHEYYIQNFDRVPEGKRLHRTQISMSEIQLQTFFEEKGIEYVGWLSLINFFPEKLERLFNYFSNKIIHFRHIETGNIINV